MSPSSRGIFCCSNCPAFLLPLCCFCLNFPTVSTAVSTAFIILHLLSYFHIWFWHPYQHHFSAAVRILHPSPSCLPQSCAPTRAGRKLFAISPLYSVSALFYCHITASPAQSSSPHTHHNLSLHHSVVPCLWCRHFIFSSRISITAILVSLNILFRIIIVPCFFPLPSLSYFHFSASLTLPILTISFHHPAPFVVCCPHHSTSPLSLFCHTHQPRDVYVCTPLLFPSIFVPRYDFSRSYWP